MAEEGVRSYGLSSIVMYPNRGEDSPACQVRVRSCRTGPPIVAHSGFVHLAGNAALLRELARLLGDLGGRLDLYTAHTDAELAGHGLIPPVVRRVGYFPAHEMAERIAATADALFLSGSFDPKDRVDVSTLFPSKLADYTAVGLPIMIWGPTYCSAARWAVENPGAALLFTEPDTSLLADALVRLTADRELAFRVAAAGVDAGKQSFELSVARDQFLRAVALNDT